MAGQNPGFEKRLREKKKREKKAEKARRKALREEAKKNPAVDETGADPEQPEAPDDAPEQPLD